MAFGFKLGSNAEAKSDIYSALPVLVKIHQSIDGGDKSYALNLTEMLILAKIGGYESLTNDLFLRLAYGKDAFNGPLFQKHLKEAIIIRNSATNNLIFVDPTKP
jgi:hypothetical protein